MISAIIATIAAVPLVILTIETLAGLAKPKARALSEPMPRTTILIPAHNEEGGIAAVVTAIKAQCPDILVVADNCSDATAANARAAGARVVERHETSARGKGHALAFGRAALADDSPDIVIIMDADCLPDTDALPILARTAAATGRVVQARYELDTRADDPPMTCISNFAFAMKNIVRQRGLMRVAGTCVLTGTGMAFPWGLFRDAPLATDDSVEDLAIGLALVRAGHRPAYADDARVTSAPASGKAVVAQRTRWEHGFIATATRRAPQMIAHGITRAKWSSIWLGLHLMVPPLALAFVVAFVALAITTALGFATGFAPALVLGGIILKAGLTVLGGWQAVGRSILPFGTLLRVPLYILWKLPIYLKLARGADRRWTRTERD
jgi:cellulose synthase/poly-beta-1,6-N-acetylglucosamine synthase-like glycosyltransferase